MKRIVTTLFMAALATTQVSAQTVLNATALPANGFVTNFYIGDSTGAGPAGANVTWDFSSLNYTNAGIITVVDPAGTPKYSKYSTANLCLEIDAMGFMIYNYYKADANAISKVGEGVSGTLPSEIDYLTDNKVWAKFPFNYNETVTDSWRGATSNGVDTILYDGYGTLITPFDTFTNVVRLRTISNDSTYGLDTTYTWFATTPILFEIMEMTDGESLILEEMPTVTTGIQNIVHENPVRIYPNPAKEYITIDAGKVKGNVAIYDATGKLVKQAAIDGTTQTIATADLKPGIYFYSLVSSNNKQYKGTVTIQ